MKKFYILIIIGILLIAIILALWQKSNSENLFTEQKCQNIFTNIKAEDFAWGKDGKILAVYKNQYFEISISNCNSTTKKAAKAYPELKNPVAYNEQGYSPIKLNNSQTIIFKENDSPGLYINDKLFLEAEKFGYWAVSSDKKSIYFTVPYNIKTKIHKKQIGKKGSVFATIDWSIQADFEISPNEKYLATLDSYNEIVVFLLR